MNGAHFDEFARAARSRRGILRIVAGAAAVGVWRPAAAATPASCLLDGESCQPANAADCCTGVCAKHKGKHVCKSTGKAFGCGRNPATNVCHLHGQAVPCPNSPGECVVDGKKPLCISAITCMTCATDADCQRALVSRVGRCIKQCPACGPEGVTSACVIPAGSPPTS